jgi:Polyketide cyclase / dehydrase and lipid transport
VGTTFVARRMFGPWKTLIDCRIRDWEDGRLVTMELRGGMVRRASVTYALEPAGDEACLVTYTTQGEMRSLLAWTTPFIPAQGRKLIRSNLATLERLLVEAATAGPAT